MVRLVAVFVLLDMKPVSKFVGSPAAEDDLEPYNLFFLHWISLYYYVTKLSLSNTLQYRTKVIHSTC